MELSFYFDPICPWCWVTARWLIGVREQRPLDIDWRPFSLAIKNQALDHPERWKQIEQEGLRALRMIESVRAAGHPEAVEKLYVEMARRRHHDRAPEFDLEEIAAASGVDASMAPAADDPAWDQPIEEAMADVLSVLGDDIGVPAIVFEGDEPIGFHGPIISSALSGDEGLRLFDAFVALAETPGFYEIKRGRDARPDPGPRP